MKKGNNKSLILIVFLIIFAMIFIYSITDNFLTNSKDEIKKYNASMVMVGDALFHETVYSDGLKKDGTYNFDSQIEEIVPIISDYDIKYYNQETILGGTELGLSSFPKFNSPREVGDAFVKAGFNLVSLANNHTMDKGEQGILNSVAYWRNQKNIQTAGSYDSYEDRERSHIGEVNGITYAFLSYTYGTNGIPVPKDKKYLVNVFNETQVKKDIKKVRKKADVVIVAVHWGKEYTHTPTVKEKRWASFLADLGVDIVIGCHPHVIQPIEHIGDTVVIYSLGNFISGQIGLMKRIGLVASLDINKVVKNGKTTISIDNIKGDLLYTYHDEDFHNFKVIPFYKLTDDLLPNYQNIKKEYEKIINKNDSSVQVGTLELTN